MAGALWHGAAVHGGTAAAAVGHGGHALALELGARVLVDVLDLLRALHLPPRHPVVRPQLNDILQVRAHRQQTSLLDSLFSAALVYGNAAPPLDMADDIKTDGVEATRGAV